MERSDRLQRLRAMVKQVVPEETRESPRSQLESLSLAEDIQEAAASGLDKLIQNVEVTPDEQHTLEAIVLPKYRPATFVIGDTFSTPPAPWEHLGDVDLKPRLERVLKSVGRIEIPRHPTAPYAGTGFVVGPNLMMTNRHVAQIFAAGIGQRQLSFKTGRTAAVDFKREAIATPPMLLQVRRVAMIHPYWDMALLEVEGLAPNHPTLALTTGDPALFEEQDVAVIGYPAKDWRSDANLQNEIFGGVFEVKRLQPGKLKGRRTIESFGNNVQAVTHDASTLGGNSGSAVFLLQADRPELEIVALHFAGQYLDANFAVPAYELARDSRVVDAGVVFSGRLPSATQDWAAVWRLAEGGRESASASLPNSSSPILSTPTGLHLTIPLNVTISIGQATVTGTVQSVGPAPSGAAASPPPLAPVSGTSSEGLEGLFGTADSDIVHRAYSKFSAGNLHLSGFDWQNALAMADCSHVVYEVPAVAINTCRNQWRLESCEFVSTDDTECFVAAAEKTIIVSFRGTKQLRDWLINLNTLSTRVAYGTVHRGFYFAFQSVKSTLEELIAREDPEQRKVILTGHSLGGALATIAAAEWCQRYSISAVYTFGQPCAGKSDLRDHLAEHYENNFFRFVNDDDIVPRVPPGYVHCGKLYHFGADASFGHEMVESTTGEPVTDTMSDDEFAELKISLLSEAERQSQEGIGLEGWIPSISDHKLDRYLEKILRNLP